MSTRSPPGRSAATAPSTTATIATSTVIGRRIPAVTRFIFTTSRLPAGRALPARTPAGGKRERGSRHLAVVQRPDVIVLCRRVAHLGLAQLHEARERGAVAFRRHT